MLKSKTNFEQIPVDVIKKIVKEYPESKQTKTDHGVVEHPQRKSELYSVKHACTHGVRFDMETGMDSDQGLEYPEWQKPYLEALVAEKSKLQERVTAAETAIFNRLQAISQSRNHLAEREAIADALRALRVLKRDKLDYPEW